jgi:hypothetical protein
MFPCVDKVEKAVTMAFLGVVGLFELMEESSPRPMIFLNHERMHLYCRCGGGKGSVDCVW